MTHDIPGRWHCSTARAPTSAWRGFRHYTGTPPEHFQHFVLFTNYVRYVDEFVRFAIDALRQPDSPFTALSVPGGTFEPGDADRRRGARSPPAVWRRHQMPAYHLMTADGDGITLVNIGVGPSNAKTICDHIAVLRPEVWLMIGHCGGLRPSQTIGDYVLAHAYLRDDHVLDDVLPVEVPIPGHRRGPDGPVRRRDQGHRGG